MDESILLRWQQFRPRVLFHNVNFDVSSPFIKMAGNYIYVVSIEGKLSGSRQQKELQNDCSNPDLTDVAVGIRFTHERCPKLMHALVHNCPPEGQEDKTEIIHEVAGFCLNHVTRPSSKRKLFATFINPFRKMNLRGLTPDCMIPTKR